MNPLRTKRVNSSVPGAQGLSGVWPVVDAAVYAEVVVGIHHEVVLQFFVNPLVPRSQNKNQFSFDLVAVGIHHEVALQFFVNPLVPRAQK